MSTCYELNSSKVGMIVLSSWGVSCKVHQQAVTNISGMIIMTVVSTAGIMNVVHIMASALWHICHSLLRIVAMLVKHRRQQQQGWLADQQHYEICRALAGWSCTSTPWMLARQRLSPYAPSLCWSTYSLLLLIHKLLLLNYIMYYKYIIFISV